MVARGAGRAGDAGGITEFSCPTMSLRSEGPVEACTPLMTGSVASAAERRGASSACTSTGRSPCTGSTARVACASRSPAKDSSEGNTDDNARREAPPGVLVHWEGGAAAAHKSAY